MSDRSGDAANCRESLADATVAVVRYRGLDALVSAPVARSLLADAIGSEGMRCRHELDLVASCATAAGALVDDAGPTSLAEHAAALAQVLGRDAADVEWALGLWVRAATATSAPRRPDPGATVVPTEATVLPTGPLPPPPDHPGPTGRSAPAPAPTPTPRQPAPSLEDLPVPSSGTTPSSAPRRVLTAAAIAVSALFVIAIGAYLWLARDNDPTPTTTSPTSSTSTSTSSTAPEVETEWASNTPPDELYQELLDQQGTVFTPARTCRPIADDDADALGTYPQGEDLASMECFYDGNRTIVYSLFADDDAMQQFFQGRLDFRNMARGEGEIGPVPPWELDYADDPERGSGSIFGYQRAGDGARSEVGFIREGASIYAYSYQLGTDYPAYYEWWADIFGGPAPPG